jgi:hypothetical protein
MDPSVVGSFSCVTFLCHRAILMVLRDVSWGKCPKQIFVLSQRKKVRYTYFIRVRLFIYTVFLQVATVFSDFSCELTVLSPFIFVSGNRVITVLRRRTCVLRVTYAIYTSKPRIRTRTLLAVTNRHPSVPHAKRTQSSRGPEWQFFGDENKRRKNRDYLQKNRVHKYSDSICMGITNCM